jgi:hypothetical protein
VLDGWAKGFVQDRAHVLADGGGLDGDGDDLAF